MPNILTEMRIFFLFFDERKKERKLIHSHSESDPQIQGISAENGLVTAESSLLDTLGSLLGQLMHEKYMRILHEKTGGSSPAKSERLNT